jgi:hypothetical protein
MRSDRLQEQVRADVPVPVRKQKRKTNKKLCFNSKVVRQDSRED